MKRPLTRAIERYWDHGGALGLILHPLSWLYRILVYVRQTLFRHGFIVAARMPVPVIVIGNVTVGGTGKTPLTLAVVEQLQKMGLHPGILSRGYGGSLGRDRWSLVTNADAARFGDEVVLLAARSKVPVAVARQRSLAGFGLLGQHPEVDVLVCDDGLQHHRLARDIELAVFDARGSGNGNMLPAGPLREPLARLKTVDAIILNGAPPASTRLPIGVTQYAMTVSASGAHPLHEPDYLSELTRWIGQTVLAAAGMGYPERFFAMLESHGLTIRRLALPDHFDFAENPFLGATEKVILITEKDAVKCMHIDDVRIFVVPVDAVITPSLETLLVEKLNGCKSA